MSLEDAPKLRPRSEVIIHLVRPPASVLIRLLTFLGVNPLFIVLAHTLIGFLAALLLVLRPGEHFILAAILLQLKTLLDNADGGVARATGQVTLTGRYLDTVLDFLANLALFAALALYGPPLLALLAFILLTLILSFDFNLERLYKAPRQQDSLAKSVPIGAPAPVYRFFKGFYDCLFAPQDRLVERLDRWFFRRLSGVTPEAAPLEVRLAWNDMFSTASLVNLGLGSQFVLLGVFLVIGQPFWYVYSLFVQALYVMVVQLLRALRFRSFKSVKHDAR